jgi:hypothetical protein
MDPTRLIPQALPIPVDWGWFYLFQVLTFIIHILVMNVMLGAAIIALVHHLRGKRETDPLTKTVSVKLPFTIAFAVNFGVAPLLFMQVLYGQFLYTSSVLMAVYWLAVVGLVIAAYGSAYIYDFRYTSLGGLKTVFIGLTALCLLATAFIFTNNMTLMLSPEAWSEYFDNPGGPILNLSDPTVLPRYLHIVASSTALGGLALALLYSRRKDDAQSAHWVRHGMNCTPSPRSCRWLWACGSSRPCPNASRGSCSAAPCPPPWSSPPGRFSGSSASATPCATTSAPRPSSP